LVGRGDPEDEGLGRGPRADPGVFEGIGSGGERGHRGEDGV
jgi:hypothetical protein